MISSEAVQQRRMVRLLLIVLTLAGAILAGPAISQGEPNPIRFARGASSATVSNSVIRGERDLYTFAAKEGQHAEVRIKARENNAVFQIYQPGVRLQISNGVHQVRGEALPGAAEGDDARRWTGTLPATGVYLIAVGGTRGNATYRLHLAIR